MRSFGIVLLCAISSISVMSSAAGETDSVTEIRCRAMVEGSDGKLQLLPDEIHVLEQTQSSAAFQVAAPEGIAIKAIQCGRSDIVPAPNDYKVLLAGYPLYIVTADPSRVAALEVSGGQLRFRLIDGPALTEDEVKRLGKRLDEMQDKSHKSSAR